VQSSGSNGVVERAVQTIEGQVRVLKLSLEERLGREVPASHCIVMFLAEYAAYLVNRLEVGKDGKTPWERSRGKSASVMGVEFGEKVMFKKKARDKNEKINARWEKGIFVGARSCSGELLVATSSGVRKCRSIRRLPLQERWGLDSLNWVKNVPWHLYRGDSLADGDIPEDNAVEPEPVVAGARDGQAGVVVKMKAPPPRSFQIRKEDAEKHGYSRGCAGCSSWFRGLGRQPHSVECRARFEKLLKDDARFQNAMRRKEEYDEKVRERAAKKAKKSEGEAGGGQRRQREGEAEEEQRRPEQPRPDVQEGGSSSSAGAADPSPAVLPPVGAEGGMEVDPPQPRREEGGPWEDLLRRVKRQKTEDEDMSIEVVEAWCQDLLAEWSRSPQGPDDEIDESRAEIMEMITAKLWSSEFGECLKTWEGQDQYPHSGSYSCRFVSAVRSIVDGRFCGDLPAIDGIVEVFGVDVLKSFVPDIYSGDLKTDVFDGRSRPAVSTVARKDWADEFEHESPEDLEAYAREYWCDEYALDDVHGGVLDISKVREARSEEIEFMKSRSIWREVPIEECWSKSGKAPVTVKWVDTEKLGGVVRSRLVARDFKSKGEKEREDLFAATPPLELLKAQLSRAASKKGRKVLVIDVKKAHLYPLCESEVFIELPPEAGAKPGTCGQLVHWLYGFRPAAQAWESHYSKNLENIGFVRGRASPVSFYDPAADVSCLVHGDDFTFVGERAALDSVEGKMKSWYELKVKARLGAEEGDDKETDILGRRVRCTKDGFEYEADPRHRRKILEAFGLEEYSKGLSSNGKVEDPAEEPLPLEASECTRFRALAARVNYLAQDAPDIQFAAKEVCRDMAKPDLDSWKKLKGLARFILEREAVIWKFDWQDEVGLTLSVFSDSDWAGCRRTRRSTSGGAVVLGGHCLRTWSSTQAPIALSSAEAEYYAMVEATTRALGIRSMLSELGVVCVGPTELYSDSSAARCFASRRGVGRMRHLEVRHLWLQGAVACQKVVVRRVPGEENPADLLTKYLSVREVVYRLNKLALQWINRHRKAIAVEGGCQDVAVSQILNPGIGR
jgi:hypothetical protein